MDEKLLKNYCWLKRGPNRQRILIALTDMRLPSEIQKDTNLRFSAISSTLRDFVQRRIASCLNNHARRGRIYELTDIGQNLILTHSLKY